MESKITELRGEVEVGKLTSLNIEEIEAPKIEGLTDAFEELTELTISTGLTSLEGFPKLKKLKQLDLSNNQIEGGLNVLAGSSEVCYLDLAGNKIKDLDALEPLKTLDKLSHLFLSENPVEETEDIRAKIFKIIPSLKYLDGRDADDQPEADDDVDDEEEDIEEEEDLDDEEDEEEGEEEGEDGPGLSAIYNENLSDDEEEFDEEGEDEEDEDIEDEEEADGEPAAKKAKPAAEGDAKKEGGGEAEEKKAE